MRNILDLESYKSLAKNLGERVGVQKNFYGGGTVGEMKHFCAFLKKT
jgi:hypothetical protein